MRRRKASAPAENDQPNLGPYDVAIHTLEMKAESLRDFREINQLEGAVGKGLEDAAKRCEEAIEQLRKIKLDKHV